MTAHPSVPMSRDVAVAEYEQSELCVLDALDEARFPDRDNPVALPAALTAALIEWFRGTARYEANIADFMQHGATAWPFD